MPDVAGWAVLWDLDGTLVDSGADIAAAVDRALSGRGLRPLGETAVRNHIGSGAQHLITACVTEALERFEPALDELVAPVLQDFYEHYQEHIADQTVVYDGVRELLEVITAPQAVVTNKPIGLTLMLLEKLGLRARFQAVYGSGSVTKRKPDPMMIHAAMADLGVTRAVLVGDGPHDVGAGQAAGIPVIGVGWGIGRPEGANVRVESVRALRGLLIG